MDGDEEGARRIALDALAAGPGAAKPGEVWLVDAGPGDPELLTLRALRALQRADTVVYDRLVAPEVLAFVRPGAESIDVGKAPRAHSCEQNAFHELLIRQVLRGKIVVRL
jgi:siroheme synthase